MNKTQSKELSTKYIPLLEKAIESVEKNGYTKVEIAKVSGVSRPTVIAIISGDTKLRLSSIIAFVKGVEKLNTKK